MVDMPDMTSPTTPTSVTLRFATSDDAAALAAVAELDSARPLVGPALLAERDGRVVAALSVADGRVVANPFVPTADLVEMLRLRAAGERQAWRVRRSGWTLLRRRPLPA